MVNKYHKKQLLGFQILFVDFQRAVLPLFLQGLDTAHKQRVADVLGDPEVREKQRSRESLTSDTVKYESGPDGGEEVSMSVEWNGVSTVHTAQPHTHYSAPWVSESWQAEIYSERIGTCNSDQTGHNEAPLNISTLPHIQN